MKRPVSPPDRSQEDRNLSKMTTTKPLAGNLGGTQVAILRQNTLSQNCYGLPGPTLGPPLQLRARKRATGQGGMHTRSPLGIHGSSGVAPAPRPSSGGSWDFPLAIKYAFPLGIAAHNPTLPKDIEKQIKTPKNQRMPLKAFKDL